MADPGQDSPLDDRPPDETLVESRADSLTRLKAFTDGTVAIALTLLVLPLVDVAGEARSQQGDDGSVLELISENGGTFIAFFLSFAVIARLWTTHRRSFALLRDFDNRVALRLVLWLVVIVWLPFPTDLLFVDDGSLRQGAATLYLGSLLAAGLVQRSHSTYVARHEHLLHSFVTPAMLREARRQGDIVLLVMGICFVVSFVWAQWGLVGLLALGVINYVPIPGLRPAPDAQETPE